MAAPTTLTVTGIILLGIGVLIGWFVFPNVFNSQIEKSKQLRKGSDMRKIWAAFPISVDFKIYLFNVTNPEEVLNGKKPILQEIGPYFFDEWKEKVILEDDPKEDTVSFHMKNTFIFNETASLPLTGNETIVMPHAMIMAMAVVTHEDKPGGLPLINKAIPYVFNNPESLFVKAPAMDIMFNGLPVNCTKHKEFAGNAVCGILKKDPKGLMVIDEDNFAFSLFGAVNGTADSNILTVKRGMQNVQEVGQVVLFNGKPEMDIYRGPYCNQIKGTDTTIFPPHLERTEIWSFGGEICRSLAVKYVKDKDYMGIHGYYYEADLGDMSTVPEERCFCPAEDQCLKKGAFSLKPCTGAPLIATLPHFHLTHPDYQRGVAGLNPTQKEHGLYSTFEPITGTPVEGRKRLQFNVFLYKVPKMSMFQNLSEEPILMPLFWVEEGADLNSTFCSKIKLLLYTPVKVVHIARWVLSLGGLAMIAGAIFLYYKRSNLEPDSASGDGDNKTTITQVSPAY